MGVAINSRNNKADNPITRKIALFFDNLQLIMLSFTSDRFMFAELWTNLLFFLRIKYLLFNTPWNGNSPIRSEHDSRTPHKLGLFPNLYSTDTPETKLNFKSSKEGSPHCDLRNGVRALK